MNWQLSELERLVAKAMDWNQYVLSIEYRGSRRMVSPIRWTKQGSILLAMCMRDGRPKHFLRALVFEPRLVLADDVTVGGDE